MDVLFLFFVLVLLIYIVFEVLSLKVLLKRLSIQLEELTASVPAPAPAAAPAPTADISVPRFKEILYPLNREQLLVYCETEIKEILYFLSSNYSIHHITKVKHEYSSAQGEDYENFIITLQNGETKTHSTEYNRPTSVYKTGRFVEL